MTTHKLINLNNVHPSWQSCLEQALQKIDPAYLATLSNNTEWLPGRDNIFNAFSLPLNKTNYILFGESPYPRAISANGYAFWDAAVGDIWSPVGMSKTVNRATSLRNIIKMLLVAEGLLNAKKTSQPDIAALDKTHLIQTNAELFTNFLNHGFLLLNATPVLQSTAVRKDANAWHPFIQHILHSVIKKRPNIQVILLGGIANTINKFIEHEEITTLYAEHPYNHTFITNKTVLDFFQPLHLLLK